MSEKTIAEKQVEIIEAFEPLGDDWLKKYTYLIGLGRALPAMDPRHLTAENLIGGCQAQIWLHRYLEQGKQYFEVECDSAIIKGIAALLTDLLSGQTPAEICAARLYCLDEIGLQHHLSPQRANGLGALVARLQSGHQNQPG